MDDDSIVMGDIDGDGKTTSNDALEILRMSTESNSNNDNVLSIADVDGDSSITANDALLVLRTSVGMADKNFVS